MQEAAGASFHCEVQLAYNWLTTNRGCTGAYLCIHLQPLFSFMWQLQLHWTLTWCVSYHIRAPRGCPQKVPYSTSLSSLMTSLSCLICVYTRLPATASASVSAGSRHPLTASLQRSLLKDTHVILSALLISKLLQPGRGQRWSLLYMPGCWCCRKAGRVYAFRNSSYSSGHLWELLVVTLEKQLFWGNQKVRLPFL